MTVNNLTVNNPNSYKSFICKLCPGPSSPDPGFGSAFPVSRLVGTFCREPERPNVSGIVNAWRTVINNNGKFFQNVGSTIFNYKHTSDIGFESKFMIFALPASPLPALLIGQTRTFTSTEFATLPTITQEIVKARHFYTHDVSRTIQGTLDSNPLSPFQLDYIRQNLDNIDIGSDLSVQGLNGPSKNPINLDYLQQLNTTNKTQLWTVHIITTPTGLGPHLIVYAGEVANVSLNIPSIPACLKTPFTNFQLS